MASQFSAEELADFLQPLEHDSTPEDDPDLMFSLQAFIGFLGSTQGDYERMHHYIHQRDPNIKMLSYYQVERRA